MNIHVISGIRTVAQIGSRSTCEATELIFFFAQELMTIIALPLTDETICECVPFACAQPWHWKTSTTDWISAVNTRNESHRVPVSTISESRRSKWRNWMIIIDMQIVSECAVCGSCEGIRCPPRLTDKFLLLHSMRAHARKILWRRTGDTSLSRVGKCRRCDQHTTGFVDDGRTCVRVNESAHD